MDPSIKSKLLFAFFLFSFSLSGCSKSHPQPIATASGTPQVSSERPDTSAQVNEAVRRVFKDAAIVDPEHNPNFIIADFNGDGSKDLAVILKARPDQLEEMNQQYPPWILRDPFIVSQPGAPPLKITSNETLLAVIHGFGPQGWQDPQATQTYLLKNSVGREITSKTKTEVVNANLQKPAPRLAGDSIAETLRGHSGYLFFNGAQYSWYDPQTFKGEVQTRLTHAGMQPRSSQLDLLHPKLVAVEKK